MTMTAYHYLDNAATTAVDPRVSAQLREALSEEGGWFANPSAIAHEAGRAAAQRVAVARAQVARLIGAEPAQIVFTSGATEADNLAVLGTTRALAPARRHVISARTEHKAVLDAVRQLTREGASVTWLRPDADGRVSPQSVAAALRPDTALVSLMHVNNETGVIQDIAALAALCARSGRARLHVDAAQSVGKCPIDFGALGIDLMSLSAHKAYGPKGAGALAVSRRRGVHLTPLVYGGGQERALRSGTLATHQAVGMGAAFALAGAALEPELERVAGLKERLWRALRALGGVYLNGGTRGVPHLLNVSFDDVEGESLLAAVSPYIAISTGSACTSASREPSYVLRALGRDDRLAESSLRFSFGRFTRESDIDAAAQAVSRAVTRLRRIAGRRSAGT